jgi:demethylmenaquinone methyltransferase/2-methoxy-6-polyprenyl-1,4-benzoquinol methylase
VHISRVNRTKIEARQAYNRLSGIYDLLAGSSEFKFTLVGLEMLGIQPGERVLEIGCGTGKAVVALTTQVGEGGKVIGIDLSRGMLEQCRHRLVKAGSDRTSLLEGDGASLPFKNESFNKVFLSFTLELFDTPEIPIVLNECLRVLQNGGLLGVVALLKSEQPGRIERLYEWFHAKLPSFVDCRPIDGSRLIQETGFWLENKHTELMWWLPVETVIAHKV